MFYKKYYVYEVDNFSVSVTPKGKYRTLGNARITRDILTHKTANLSMYLSYKILKANKGETFRQAHDRVLGDVG